MPDEIVTLSAQAGMYPRPTETEWKRWAPYLTLHERQVYRYLRWKATFPGGVSDQTIRGMARSVGDETHRWKWFGTGPMSMATFKRALDGLVRAGLVERDDDARD